MKYDINRLADCHTGSIIEKYEIIYYEDSKEIDCYLVYFENSYVLEIDSEEITEKELKELIKDKSYVSIEFKIELWKHNK